MKKTEQNRVLAWRLKIVGDWRRTPERGPDLPSFRPFTPSVLQMESPIRGSWGGRTVRSATCPHHYPARGSL
jgi:hypothetical protein